MLNRLKLSNWPTKCDAFLGVSDGNLQRRFKRTRHLRGSGGSPHHIKRPGVQTIWRRLNHRRRHAVKGHRVLIIPGDVEPFGNRAIRRRHKRNDRRIPGMGENRNVPGVRGKRYLPNGSRQGTVGAKSYTVIRTLRRDRHHPCRRLHTYAGQQPPRQQCFTQWHRRRKAAGHPKDVEPVGNIDTGATQFIRHPSQG